MRWSQLYIPKRRVMCRSVCLTRRVRICVTHFEDPEPVLCTWQRIHPMPSGFEMSWPKANYNNIEINFALYLNIRLWGYIVITLYISYYYLCWEHKGKCFIGVPKYSWISNGIYHQGQSVIYELRWTRMPSIIT